jgi:hypothetical protein
VTNLSRREERVHRARVVTPCHVHVVSRRRGARRTVFWPTPSTPSSRQRGRSTPPRCFCGAASKTLRSGGTWHSTRWRAWGGCSRAGQRKTRLTLLLDHHLPAFPSACRGEKGRCWPVLDDLPLSTVGRHFKHEMGVGMGTYVPNTMNMDGEGYGSALQTPPAQPGIAAVIGRQTGAWLGHGMRGD